jgi:hypothetical protein
MKIFFSFRKHLTVWTLGLNLLGSIQILHFCITISLVLFTVSIHLYKSFEDNKPSKV